MNEQDFYFQLRDEFINFVAARVGVVFPANWKPDPRMEFILYQLAMIKVQMSEIVNVIKSTGVE